MPPFFPFLHCEQVFDQTLVELNKKRELESTKMQVNIHK